MFSLDKVGNTSLCLMLVTVVEKEDGGAVGLRIRGMKMGHLRRSARSSEEPGGPSASTPPLGIAPLGSFSSPRSHTEARVPGDHLR